MKKIIFSTIGIFGISLLIAGTVFAQGMMGFPNSSADSSTIQSQQQEEQQGKNVLNSLNNKTTTCLQISDSDFEKIGEYFMGQSIGDTSRHIAMNEMMKSMMGEQGEEQVHIAWGKRGSGCDTSAAFPSQYLGFMPMMQMMMGGWPSPGGYNQSNNNSMMWGFGNPMGWSSGAFGWIFMVLLWVLIIVGIVSLIRWLGWSRNDNVRRREKTALDILKGRYAKGEMDKKEFEERKKDLI